MNRRRANRQLDLFSGGVAQLGHNGAPCGRKRESSRIYRGVLFLRIYACKDVWRVGREHLVGGRQVSTRQLLELTRAECRKCCRSDELPDYVLQRLGVS